MDIAVHVQLLGKLDFQGISFLEATPNNVHNAEEEGKEDLKKIDVQG